MVAGLDRTGPAAVTYALRRLVRAALLSSPACPPAASRSSPPWWAPRRSAPRSPRRGCSRRGSAPRRSSGRTRSRPCSSRCRRATGSAGAPPAPAPPPPGRRAARGAPIAGVSRVVLGAAALLAVVPFIAGPFLRVSVEALDRVEAGAFVGSLVAVLVLVAAPVLLLGAVAPYAVRLSVRSVDEAGRVAGRLYAISTLGSLAGVFLRALVLIPLVGTRRTFLSFALSLAVVAVPALGRRFVLAPLALAALIAIPVGTVKATGDARVIWDRETEYQYARVVQAGDGERTLEVNEGQAIHSEFRPGEWLTGDYWDEMLVLPFAAGRGAPQSVAILGN